MNPNRLLSPLVPVGLAAGAALGTHLFCEVRSTKSKLDQISTTSRGQGREVLGVHWTTEDGAINIVNKGANPGVFFDDSTHGVAYYGVLHAVLNIPKATYMALSGDTTAARQSITPRAVAFVAKDNVDLSYQSVREYIDKVKFNPVDGGELRLPVLRDGPFDVGTNLTGWYITEAGLSKVTAVDPTQDGLI